MDNFKVVDENGKESVANIVTAFSYQDKEYLIYSVDENEEESSIFVSRLEKDEEGFDKIVDIEDPKEKNEIDRVVSEILSDIK